MVIRIKYLLLALCLLRFFLPFYISPLGDNLASDMRWKYWHNGINFFDQSYVGAISPKLYQLWIFFIYHISQGNGWGILFFTGLLCAIMPWLWYKAFREIFSGNISAIIAIIIAITPSLLFIYSYLMGETLFLVLLPLSFWLSFRAVRKKQVIPFMLAVLCWMLVSHTRIIALPLALVMIIYMFFYQERKFLAILMASSIIIAMVILPGIHSKRVINVFAPFHFTLPNQIYRKAGTISYSYLTEKEGHSFFCPSSRVNPLAPFFEYKSYRKNENYHFQIDTRKGLEDWLRAYKEVDDNYSWNQYLGDLRDNFVYLIFAPSWPDAHDGPYHWTKSLNFHTRWMWPPLIFLILIFTPFMFRKLSDQRHILILILTYLLLILLIFQTAGVMEGRFRKPIEPLIIISSAIIVLRLFR